MRIRERSMLILSEVHVCHLYMECVSCVSSPKYFSTGHLQNMLPKGAYSTIEVYQAKLPADK